MTENERSIGVQPEYPQLSENLLAGLALLRQAYDYANDARAVLWDFALEKDNLLKAGLTINDLRWLVAKGLVEHGQETSFYGDKHRSFRISSGLNFEQTTCLVLTRAGAVLAAQLSDQFHQPIMETPSHVVGSDGQPPPHSNVNHNGDDVVAAARSLILPHWNSISRELCVANRIVKRFRVPAPNQELVLCAFQEEGWPAQIDDPLPCCYETDPATRLHSTINRLNGRQKNLLLRFRGNGRGTGVCWELRRPAV